MSNSRNLQLNKDQVFDPDFHETNELTDFSSLSEKDWKDFIEAFSGEDGNITNDLRTPDSSNTILQVLSEPNNVAELISQTTAEPSNIPIQDLMVDQLLDPVFLQPKESQQNANFLLQEDDEFNKRWMEERAMQLKARKELNEEKAKKIKSQAFFEGHANNMVSQSSNPTGKIISQTQNEFPSRKRQINFIQQMPKVLSNTATGLGSRENPINLNEEMLTPVRSIVGSTRKNDVYHKPKRIKIIDETSKIQNELKTMKTIQDEKRRQSEKENETILSDHQNRP